MVYLFWHAFSTSTTASLMTARVMRPRMLLDTLLSSDSVTRSILMLSAGLACARFEAAWRTFLFPLRPSLGIPRCPEVKPLQSLLCMLDSGLLSAGKRKPRDPSLSFSIKSSCARAASFNSSSCLSPRFSSASVSFSIAMFSSSVLTESSMRHNLDRISLENDAEVEHPAFGSTFSSKPRSSSLIPIANRIELIWRRHSASAAKVETVDEKRPQRFSTELLG
mmetsp:Transcript_37847/g.113140  ORF Transcript_37847/g.113140 Transcript_37847/m.113140 type:complete len:222 (+) Transcript_37847:454-1119(+)